ncbi:hypothetical protein PENCOP_c005G00227 [Penicillium coprophilum]|uniref:Zn(2)-C6 fungal-type domain-containing protein n=1 Tax=Penicillium coprophilum TaxID=36646 RepID=A0A1V6URG0_9EURO|nr:hypothetical protein PENCOP_c005G00227 [Penicillium coprophilum]
MIEHRRRNRTRTACIACQIRKRKCSGTQPCSTCSHLNSECQYDQKGRPGRSLRRSRSTEDVRPNGDAAQSARTHVSSRHDHNVHLSSTEANSGAAFARSLGLKIDPLLAPKLNMYAWNTGLRHSMSATAFNVATVPLVEIISQNEMKYLATIYFEKIDPYYNFLDRDEVFLRIGERWQSSGEPAPAFAPYDGVLCGVAALGALFSQREATPKEYQLLELAKLVLEQNQHSHVPSTDLITAWVLRVSYLRIAGTPHLAWVASCTLMHLIEAAGLHVELPSGNMSNILAESSETTNIQSRRRLFGIARHFNLWISFELGRTRVTFPSATTQLPDTNPNGIKDIYSFLGLSETLDPEEAPDISALEQALTDIMDMVDLRPPMILTQCNLMLCIHRRLQSLNAVLSGEMFDRFVNIIRQGLRAAREMVVSHCPWHQVANVPFQIICTLLSIGTHASISLLSEAMQTVRQIATSYDTEKEQDAKALDSIVQTELPISTARNQPVTLSTQPHLMGQPNLSWMGNAMAELPNLQNIYLDPPLMMDDLWMANGFEI